MQATLRKIPAAAPDSGDEAPVPEEAVRSELGRILQSSAFRGSQRSQGFLRYVVEKTLASQWSDLKERNLAVELFGRPPEVNLAEDTIVRVSAREVRRRLQQHYASAEGARAALRIHLPPGSYVPEFRRPEARPEPVDDPPGRGAEPVAAPSARRRRSPSRIAWALASAAFLGLVVWAFWRNAGISPEAALAELFWRPVMSSGREVLIGVPHPIVYYPSVRALRESAKRQPPREIPLQRELALPLGELAGSDFVPVQDQYVAFGDLLAVSHLHAMLAARKKSVRLRLASKLDPADLKETATIQIGAYSNLWALELGRNLRFRFSRTQDGRSCILDTANPGRLWALPTITSDGAADQDYLLITRLVSGQWGQPAVLAAGLKQFGTGAGGQLLSNPPRLGALLRSLENVPWRKANLQMVLAMRVIGSTPATPQLVAWHVW